MSGYQSKRKAANTKISKPKLSLCTHFYNSLDAVEFQVNQWKQIDQSYLNQIEFVVVDDCSDDICNVNVEDMLIQMFRVTTSINWNQAGCKNLLLSKSQADWLFFFDIDTTASASNIQKILDKLPSLDVNCIYMPKVKYPWGQQRIAQKIDESIGLPHINCFVIHKNLLNRIGGFDEDFVGNYGYEDTYMHNQLNKIGAKRVFMADVNVNMHLAYSVGLSRNMSHNENLIYKKAKENFPIPENPIRFEYKEITCGTQNN